MSSSSGSEPPSRNTIFAFLILVITILGAVAALMASRPQPVQITINPPVPTGTPAPSATPGPITVYVTGMVVDPDTLVTLPAGSRVEDAITAAGGALDGANLELVNLAGVLHDGDQVHVPASALDTAEATSETAPLEAVPTRSGGNVVYINTATLEELQTLPHIGAGLAQRIIDYRDAHGPFHSMEDLDNVSGIGPSTLSDLEGLVSFQ